MPLTESREIAAASRLDNVRYAIRDLACIADEVALQGHKILALNIGDPLTFDFATPPHMIEAVYRAMKDGKNGYAPSSGIKQALDAIRGEAARKGITTVQDVFVTSGVLSGLSGFVTLARFGNVTVEAGRGLELEVVAGKAVDPASLVGDVDVDVDDVEPEMMKQRRNVHLEVAGRMRRYRHIRRERRPSEPDAIP